LPPKFDGTLRPKRHSNSFPWTYEWKTHKNVERTELLFKTVNHETRKFEVRSEDAQKFVLTEANTQADLPQYGSIDVEVTSITGCGERSEPVKTVVCDTDIRVSPKINFSSDYGPKGGELQMKRDTCTNLRGTPSMLPKHTLLSEKSPSSLTAKAPKPTVAWSTWTTPCQR